MSVEDKNHPEKSFEPKEYLDSVTGLMDKLVLEYPSTRGGISFGKVRQHAPYDQLNWPELYEEGEIAATFAFDALKEQGVSPSFELSENVYTLVVDINRASAMLGLEDPDFIRLAQLDDDRFASVMSAVVDSIAPAPQAQNV